jgi:hypothetical protein
MTTRTPFFRTALRMCAGIIVWAVHFAVIYGYAALACALGLGEVRWPGATVSVVVVAATVIALGATLAVVVLAMRAKTSAFEDWMTAGIAAIAAVAILWEGLLPVFILPACT